MSEAPAPAKTIAALSIGALAIGFAAPFFRAAAPIDPLLASAVRLALAALLLSPAIPGARRDGRLSARTLRAAALAGGLYAVHFGAWVASLGMTSVAASVTLVTATPLLLAVTGWLTGRDAPTPRLSAGLALATAGAVVIGASDSTESPGALAGDLLALLGALAMVGILLLVRREQAALEALSFSSVAALVGAVALASVIVGRGAALGEWPRAPSYEALGWVAATAVVSQLVGHTALTWATQRTTPTLVGLATTTEPIIAAAVTFAWMGEVPSALVLAGSALTLAGVLLGASSRGAASSPKAQQH